MVVFVHQTSRTQYRITLQHDQQKTLVSMQDKCAIEIWNGIFDPTYIEKLTAKAGYQLTYHRWYQILTSALSKQDLTCYVDVLTSNDLDRLRGKKSTEAQNKGSKRYLILTLMQNQTRSHFPLPLKPSNPKRSIEQLRKIYMQLQNPAYQQNLLIKSKRIVQIEQCKAQNDILKQKLKRLQNRQIIPDIDAQRQLLAQKAQKVQNDFNNNIQQLQRKQLQLTIQLQSLRSQMSKRRAKLIADDAKASRQQAQNQRQLAKVKQQSIKYQRQLQRLKNQIETSKRRQKDQQNRAKQLQAQYDAARKQKMGRGSSPYSSGGSLKSRSIGSSKPRSLNKY